MLHNKIVLLILSQLTTLSTSYKGKEEFGFISSYSSDSMMLFK